MRGLSDAPRASRGGVPPPPMSERRRRDVGKEERRTVCMVSAPQRATVSSSRLGDITQSIRVSV